MATVKLHPSIGNSVERFDVLAHTEADRLDMLRAYEQGKLVLLEGASLGLDFALFERIRIPPHPDTRLQYLISKLSMADYLDVLGAGQALSWFRRTPPRRRHPDPEREEAFRELKAYLRQGAFASGLLRRQLAGQMIAFERRVLGLHAKLFPEYGYERYSINWRLTESRGESLHVDAYRTDHDFHQVKLFVNLDSAPRIWNVGEQMRTLVARHLRDRSLDQFLHREYHRFLEDCDRILFDREEGPADCLRTHTIFFDPGDVWLAETRHVPHQVLFGRKMVSVQFYIPPARRVAPEASMERFVASLAAATPRAQPPLVAQATAQAGS